MASSEAYNAGLTWDSDGPMAAYGNRSRSGSSALRPAIDLEGRARSYSDPKARRGPKKADEGLLADESELRDGVGEDLNATWGQADDRGLSSAFGRLRASTVGSNGSGNRSRSNSKPPLPSFDEDEYTPYETESKFAARYGGNGSSSSPRRVNLNEDTDPFGGESSTSGRAFEAYTQPTRPSHPRKTSSYSSPNRRTSTPPNLTLKPGLTPGLPETGYARAIALFDLPAGQAGDLPLKKGGVLFVMDKVGTGGEWWRGMNSSGEAGIFPANYVEVVEIPKELKGGLSRGELKKRVPGLDFD
jgi:hypothetical protein